MLQFGTVEAEQPTKEAPLIADLEVSAATLQELGRMGRVFVQPAFQFRGHPDDHCFRKAVAEVPRMKPRQFYALPGHRGPLGEDLDRLEAVQPKAFVAPINRVVGVDVEYHPSVKQRPGLENPLLESITSPDAPLPRDGSRQGFQPLVSVKRPCVNNPRRKMGDHGALGSVQ